MKELIEELRYLSGVIGDADGAMLCQAADAIEDQAATIARYETTAENYELLQAKVDEQAREIERIESERAEQWRIRRDAVADIDTKSAIIAELRAGQALEIGRITRAYTSELDELAQRNYNMRFELAALKAQPGAVVLVEHLRNAHAFIENTEAFGAAASHGVLECGGARWNIDASKAALTEIARLNSSPVSAPITATNDQIAAVMLLHGTPEQQVEAARYAGLPVASASAGGADERAAFEAAVLVISKRHNYTESGVGLLDREPVTGCYRHTWVDSAWIGWQARAALTASAPTEDWGVFASYLLDKCEGDTISEEGLQRALHSMFHDPHYGALFRCEKASAPNHSEQVREVDPESYGLPPLPWKLRKCNESSPTYAECLGGRPSFKPVYLEPVGLCIGKTGLDWPLADFILECVNAAAPSAGSGD